MPEQPFRVVVEVATPEVVKRLEEENQALRNDLRTLRSQHEKLHETVYLLMNRFGELKRSLKDK